MKHFLDDLRQRLKGPEHIPTYLDVSRYAFSICKTQRQWSTFCKALEDLVTKAKRLEMV